jgi:hypothetical protein
MDLTKSWVIVIGIPVPDNSQPTPLSGVTASVGFYRSSALTESSFVELTNQVFDQNFTNGNDAKAWLNLNGYWTSFNDVTPTPTATVGTSPTPTPTTTLTATPTQTGTPTGTPASTSTSDCDSNYLLRHRHQQVLQLRQEHHAETQTPTPTGNTC